MRDRGAFRRRPLRSAVALGLLAGACAPRAPIVLPEGPGTPFPGFAEAFETAIAPCRQVQTMELALSISARRGDSRLRGDVLGALARPASVRLIGVAPFGAPAFELVAAPDDVVLLLPRDRQVVRDADAEDLLEALAGLPLGPADLRAVLTGCVVPEPRASGARRFPDGWSGVQVDGPATIYLREVDGVPTVVAGARPGLRVEYAEHVRGLPRRVRVVTNGRVPTDLTARLSQVNINTELHPEVFVASVAEDYTPLSLEQFQRGEGPLTEASDSGGSPP